MQTVLKPKFNNQADSDALFLTLRQQMREGDLQSGDQPPIGLLVKDLLDVGGHLAAPG